MDNREAGVYTGLTEAEYNEIEGIRHSDLMAFANPKDKPGRKSAIVGTCVHALALQGEEQAKKVFRVCDTDYDLRKKDQKADYKVWEDKHPGKLILRPKEMDQVWAMTESVRSPQSDNCPLLHPAGPDSREVVIVGPLWDGGPLAKARLDFFGPVIRDFKTSHSISLEEFEPAVVKYGYHSQLAFYAELAKRHLPEIMGYELYCVSSREPHNRWIYEVPDLLLQAGLRDVRHLIGCMKREKGRAEEAYA
jgi:hypothetical protein